jgi:hypothetical protein
MTAKHPFVEPWFDNKVQFGDGGLHSVLCEDIYAETTKTHKIVNIDVASYYPALMTKGKLITRASRQPQLLDVLMKKRLAIKEKKKNNPDLEAYDQALKIVINGLYGAMGNEHLSAYDPCMRSSICRVGQLMLVALCHRIHNECGARILKTNTDGILIYVHRDKYKDMKAIVRDWEKTSGFTMEYENIRKTWQRNVSNYIQLVNKSKKKVNIHGTWVWQAYPNKFRVKKPLNAPICQRAVVEHLCYGKSIKRTIRGCKDLLEFCFTKAKGHSFDYCFQQTIDEGNVEIQDVNRIIATTNPNYGELYKCNEGAYRKERVVKMSATPMFCKIVNKDLKDEKSAWEELHYDWYINNAKELLPVHWIKVCD